MTTSSRKPFWKRKRWLVATVLWLIVLYPLSMGPFMYPFYMDWVPDKAMRVVQVVYGPLGELSQRWPAFDDALNDYCDWWFEVSVRHRKDEFEPLPPVQYGNENL